MRRWLVIPALLAALAGGRPAEAHEVRPGFLELREIGPETYHLLWKKPAGGEVEISIAPLIPEECQFAASGQQTLTPGALVVRGTLTCSGGIEGKTLAIDGLESTVTDVIVRVHHADGRLESHVLKPVSPSVTLGVQTSGWQRAFEYVRLGVEHILLGVDHLLFVLGLLLIVGDRWTLVKTITSFTVAHSITLAIATLGYASAPLPPLNAAIALEHPLPRAGDRTEVARRDELHDPPSVDRRLRVRPAARIRVRERFDDDGIAAGRDSARAAAVQRRGRDRPVVLRRPHPRSRARVSNAADSVAAVRGGPSRVCRRIAGRLLDDPAHAHALGRTAVVHPPRIRLFVVAMLVLSAGVPLFAHDQTGAARGFLTGFLHPLSGLDHVVAMIAVGLWGAQLGPPALWLLPITFPMVMAVGGFLGLIGVALPGVEIGIALSALLLGAMVASEARPSLAIAAVARRGVRHLSRPRARNRAAGGSERTGLQHWLRGRDGVAPRRRDC